MLRLGVLVAISKSRSVISQVASRAYVEKGLREQQAEGVEIPEGKQLDELALRILVAVETGRSHI